MSSFAPEEPPRWSSLPPAQPLEVGLAFDSSHGVLYAVQDYALSVGRGVMSARRGGTDCRISCSSGSDKCGFFVQSYRQRVKTKRDGYGMWYISSMDLTHAEGCASTPRWTQRLILQLPAFISAFSGAIHGGKKPSGNAIMEAVQQTHGITLPKRTLYRARDMAAQALAEGDLTLGVKRPESLPQRVFVRQRQTTPEKNPERMAWNDNRISTLLRERLWQYGSEFAGAKTGKHEDELWTQVQDVFNSTHDTLATIVQLRIKFKSLQLQYETIRSEEEKQRQVAANDGEAQGVTYPSYWGIFLKYFAGEVDPDDPEDGEFTATASESDWREVDSGSDSEFPATSSSSAIDAVRPEQGMVFKTGTEAVHAVQDYALSVGKGVKVMPASGLERRIACSLGPEKCVFFIHVKRKRLSDKSYGEWYVASLNLEHSNGCTSTPTIKSRQLPQLPEFVSAVRDFDKTSANDLIKTIEMSHGVTPSKALVYRARRALVREIDSKTTPEQKAAQLVWNEARIATLLQQRLRQYGREFDHAANVKEEWKLWGKVQRVFNETHDMQATAAQLRTKFRAAKAQYERVRLAEEANADADDGKGVVYPGYWTTLIKYFGDSEKGMGHGDAQENRVGAVSGRRAAGPPSAQGDETREDYDEGHDGRYVGQSAVRYEGGANEGSSGEGEVDPPRLRPPARQERDLRASVGRNGSPSVELIPTQPRSAATARVMAAEAPSPTPPLDSHKRRRVDWAHASCGTRALAAEAREEVVTPSRIAVVESRLERLQTTQDELVQSLRGIQQAVEQSNQVNTALLDFLKAQSGYV